MPDPKAYLITNREVSDKGGPNFISVNKATGEYLRTDGRETAQDDLRFGEINFELKKGKVKLSDFEVKLYPDLPYDELRKNTEDDSVKSAKKLSSFELFNTLHKKAKPGKQQRQDILFFIHGYKNDLEVALRTVHELYRQYVVPKESPIEHIVMFTWPARKNLLMYRDDARDAVLSGYALARAYQKLRSFFHVLVREERPFCEANIHLMCHSMGNRVLESMLEHLQQSNQRVNNLFAEGLLVGADVDYDTLEAPKPLNAVIDLCARVHIYYHQQDRALLISETTKNAFNRLGLWGAKNSIALPDDVYQCDVTDIEDEDDGIFDDIKEKVVHHWYYINSTAVIADIHSVLNGQLSLFADEF